MVIGWNRIDAIDIDWAGPVVAQCDELLLLLLHNFKCVFFFQANRLLFTYSKKRKSKAPSIGNWEKKCVRWSFFALHFLQFHSVSIGKCWNEWEKETPESILSFGSSSSSRIATLNIINNDFDTRQIQKTNKKEKQDRDREMKETKHREQIAYTLIGPVETITNKQISMRPFCYVDAVKCGRKRASRRATHKWKSRKKCRCFFQAREHL